MLEPEGEPMTSSTNMTPNDRSQDTDRRPARDSRTELLLRAAQVCRMDSIPVPVPVHRHQLFYAVQHEVVRGHDAPSFNSLQGAINIAAQRGLFEHDDERKETGWYTLSDRGCAAINDAGWQAPRYLVRLNEGPLFEVRHPNIGGAEMAIRSDGGGRFVAHSGRVELRAVEAQQRMQKALGTTIDKSNSLPLALYEAAWRTPGWTTEWLGGTFPADLPSGIDKEKWRKWRLHPVRPEQPEFRKLILKLFDGRCAVSGCRAVEALQAAHIAPFAAGGPPTAENGLLLRADLHLLFDAGLLVFFAEDDDVFTVHFHSSVAASYAELDERVVPLPDVPKAASRRQALKDHRLLDANKEDAP